MSSEKEIGQNWMYVLNLFWIMVAVVTIVFFVSSCEKNKTNKQFEEIQLYLDKGYIKKSFYSENGYRYEQWVRDEKSN